MSTTMIAINSANTANMIAASAASRARDAECRVVLHQYDSQVATVVEMRGYADCVYRIHPSPVSDSGVLVIKAFIIIAILGAIAGASYCKRSQFSSDGWVDYIMYSLSGLVLLPCAVALLGVFGYAIWFLFT